MKQYVVILGNQDLNWVRDMDGHIQLGNKQKPTTLYEGLENAEAAAKQLATVNPQIPVLIFEAIKIVETKQPEFHEKKFNERGEVY